ncbi:hypothetical protein C8Q77DRAFT_1054929 [Trametes polyzona]|nr:hypothetical protein C8Q77DRAFT_1054929 [Trametes polyzona]
MIPLPPPAGPGAASLTTPDVQPDTFPESPTPPKPAQQPIITFPSPFTFILNNPVPLVELRLRRFARTIREKPRWWEKVHDPVIVARWTREIVEHDRACIDELWGGERRFDAGSGEKQWPRDPITEAQLRYLFDELRFYASQRDEETGISETTIPMVYESSTLIPPALKESLGTLAQQLEDVSEDEKDWHPGSDEQVLDLVHPSLFCLRIGRSFVHDPHPGRADPLKRLTEEDYFRQRPDIQKRHPLSEWQRGNNEPFLPFEFTVSKAYQWLPTDFAVSESGQVTPQGYINNLNPALHTEGYQTISFILERFIPMFERVVADQLSPPRPLVFPIDPEDWHSHPEAEWPEGLERREADEWERVHRWPLIPDARPFEPPHPEDRVTLSLKGRTLQVIVKMANIELTPTNPRYPGGSWHVEGMANERIVATGLFYHSSTNITESRLAFRAAVGDGVSPWGTFLSYEQWDHRGWLAVFGLSNDHALNQDLGHVVAREGACVVFPNVYQHRVAPFELADPTRPGHRKILAFFLVDPLTRVHSTSDVPPQQAEWYREAISGVDAFRKLPPELVEFILDYVFEGKLTMEEAKADREELMKERTQFVVKHNKDVFEAEFGMCEH